MQKKINPRHHANHVTSRYIYLVLEVQKLYKLCLMIISRKTNYADFYVLKIFFKKFKKYFFYFN